MEIVRGLYGSKIERSQSCAFCTHHKCHLTVKQLKQHDCLKKQCHYLHKHEDHDWWRQRALVKQKRVKRKERLDRYVDSVRN